MGIYYYFKAPHFTFLFTLPEADDNNSVDHGDGDVMMCDLLTE